MNISCDIFELADFPVVTTDKDFVILYKNKIATDAFGRLRKRSKINRYFINTNNCDISSPNACELEIETGTQIKRALTFLLYDNEGEV